MRQHNNFWGCALTSQSRFSSAEVARRQSLKRGYAREAISRASPTAANVPYIFAKIRESGPSIKARMRLAKQLKKIPGVIASSYSTSGCIRVVYKEVAVMRTRHEDEELFEEDVLLYSNVFSSITRSTRSLHIARVSLNYHSLERLIERSNCEIGPGFPQLVDLEANHIFRELVRETTITHNEDEFIRSRYSGVWAGSMDASPPDPEWFTEDANKKAPIFSIRTFLSPDEMHPYVWMKWSEGAAENQVE